MIQHVHMAVAAVPQGISSDLFDLQMPLVEKVVRTVAVYLGIAALIRVAGKRLMGR